MLHDAVCSECMYIHHGKSSSLPAAAAAVVTAGYGSVSSRRTRGEGTETFRFRCGAAAVFPTDWLAGGQDVWPGGAVVTRSFPFGMGCVCVCRGLLGEREGSWMVRARLVRHLFFQVFSLSLGCLDWGCCSDGTGCGNWWD
jgi:hypothetical protein